MVRRNFRHPSIYEGYLDVTSDEGSAEDGRFPEGLRAGDERGVVHGGNRTIRNGLKVFGSGELVWKTDVFGVWGEFRSEFRSFRAFSSVGRATDF